MRVHIGAVGRMRSGPESTLYETYRTRFDRTGRQIGLGPLHLHEVEDKKGGGMSAEAQLLRRTVPDGAAICCLDERGQALSSPQFSRWLSKWRDAGTGDVIFLIGGADGLDPDLRASAGWSLSLGQMVWPHLLVRVMLAEQLFRAAGILAGTPYHRS